jgi:hypothetical protein
MWQLSIGVAKYHVLPTMYQSQIEHEEFMSQTFLFYLSVNFDDVGIMYHDNWQLCCLHIYLYLELTGQVSIFSYFQFHFHFDCTFTSFFDDFLFPVSLCTTMPLHQCEV